MTLFLPPHTVCAGLFLAWTWRLHGVGQQTERLQEVTTTSQTAAVQRM